MTFNPKDVVYGWPHYNYASFFFSFVFVFFWISTTNLKKTKNTYTKPSLCLPACYRSEIVIQFLKIEKKNNLTFFYLLYILTSFLSLSFSICCYSEINRALSYRPKWVSKPRPYRNGIYDGRSTCGRGSHDASPAAGWIQLRLPTSSRGLLAILRTSVVQVRIQPFLINIL